jgi:hypothetical protein
MSLYIESLETAGRAAEGRTDWYSKAATAAQAPYIITTLLAARGNVLL